MGEIASKTELRRTLRKERRDHAAALPPQVSALVFKQPPRPVLDLVPDGAAVGLYSAADGEAPTASYIRFFHEAGHTIALPCLNDKDAAMSFAEHTDPFEYSDLINGPYGLQQPSPDAEAVTPQVLFIPLLGFTENGARLGQGGGHYDRWLAAHPDTIAIGLAWDVQKRDQLPTEAHDMPLTAIVTPTRIYGPF